MKIKIENYQLDNDEWMEENQDDLNWGYISIMESLSEDFIEKYVDKVDWLYISESQKLSEAFIVKHADKVDWYQVSRHQKLSESFIEKYREKIDWYWVSVYQKLSESFIEKYVDKVDWQFISAYQKLSEDFIEKYRKKIDWYWVSIYQKLSESFIEKHWKYLCEFKQNLVAYQKLSDDFLNKHNLVLDKDNWLYKDTAFKKQQVVDTGLYECYDEYFIAYKGVRRDRYSHFNFQYQYLPEQTYTCRADYTCNENSFGLSAWTEKEATSYCDELVIKVKINYEDVARVVHHGGKIRCSKLTTLT